MPPKIISIKKDNIFDSDCQILVNPTNTEGIMGGGLALAFKNKYPEMFEEYVRVCERGQHTVLEPHLWWDFEKIKENEYRTSPAEGILNLATKDLIREDSKISWVCAGLTWIGNSYREFEIESIAFPALGCGLGNLDWDEVQPIMLDFIDKMDLKKVDIYEPV